MATLIPSFASFKGGLYKTNNSILPENYLAASGRRVLSIDLDRISNNSLDYCSSLDKETKIGGNSDA